MNTMATNRTDSLIPGVMILAGMVNFLVLVFNKGFTNDYLVSLAPDVFSNVGAVAILLWGLAYICAARHYRVVRMLIGVFALEKALYAATWVLWMQQNANRLGEVYETSPLTGLMMTIYGPVDLSFCLFFAWVFVRTGRRT